MATKTTTAPPAVARTRTKAATATKAQTPTPDGRGVPAPATPKRIRKPAIPGGKVVARPVGKALAPGWQEPEIDGPEVSFVFLDGIFTVECLLPHGYGMNTDGIASLERAIAAARLKYPTRMDDHRPLAAAGPKRARKPRRAAAPG